MPPFNRAYQLMQGSVVASDRAPSVERFVR